VLIGADGYIKLTDFGLSKNNIMGEFDTFSVCGTPEYLAPEVIKKEGHGKAVDWWCLGSIIYELVHGLPPFYTKNRNDLFDRIKHEQPFLNKNWSNNLKDLFAKSPADRMQHVPTLKTHPWFSSIDWERLARKELKAPFVPVIHSESDVSNFAKEFTACSIESHASSFGDEQLFEGFSYEHKKSPTSPEMAKAMMEM
jgi:serum/glucocorticoid-regulated kinase 2